MGPTEIVMSDHVTKRASRASRFPPRGLPQHRVATLHLFLETPRTTSQMATRTSARASTRSHTSSTVKQRSDRQSRSPVGRQTRSARSGSIDLGGSDIEVPASTGLRRSRRQASVESEGSVVNSASESSRLNSRGGKKALEREESPGLLTAYFRYICLWNSVLRCSCRLVNS